MTILQSLGGIDDLAKEKSYSEFILSYVPRLIPEDVPQFLYLLEFDNLKKHVANGENNLQIEIRRADFTHDGSYHWVRMTMVVLEKDEHSEQKVLIISNDINDLAKANIEQSNANLRFVRTVSKLYDFVYEGCIYSNELYHWNVSENGLVSSEKLDYTIESMVSHISRDVTHPDYADEYYNTFCLKNLTNSYHNGIHNISLEALRLAADGTYHWFLMELQFIGEYNNDVNSIYYIKDIDKTKREAEEKHQLLVDALNYAEKANTYKTDFLSRMSHDIRTPMNAIIGMNKIASDNTNNKDKLADCFNKIDASAKYLLSLINDILDMSKIEQGKVEFVNEKFSIHEFMDKIYICCSPQTNLNNQNLTIFVADNIEDFYIGDTLKLNQILMNLLSNAIKFTPENGDITVNLSIIEQNADYDIISFEVEDTGIGMTSENIDRIFEPFEQVSPHGARHYEGSGLGLTIAKSMTHMMKGHISVKSELSVGTKFTVNIPLKRADGTVRQGFSDVKITPDYLFNGERILVAEDNEINLEIMINILENKGLTYETAINGAEAVRIISSYPEHYFQAVLMDIRMPVLDGLEATKKIRSLESDYAKKLPIIAMTANAFREEMEKAKQCGINEYLTKPIDINLFTETMYRALYINNYGN